MSRNELPSASAPNFLARIREEVQTYLGRQGDPLNRGLTVRDLLEAGVIRVRDGFSLKSGQVSDFLPLSPVAAADEVDLTPPPQPSGFSVSSAISHVFIEHDDPVYKQGHGHKRTRVYGLTVAPNAPLPTFADAVELTQFTGAIHAHPSNPATVWRLWIKWESQDGELSATPAGGTNGLEAVTGQDVSLLLKALTGEITESQLYATLGARINLIDNPTTGLVKKTSDLVVTYGSTAAAATSASNAAAAEAEAILAKTAALSARDSSLQYASNASTSATTATTKASQAGVSATNAASSATAAGTSASNAATSATTAATSATTAAGSATAASTSATNAATSATAAGTSATASNTAKVAAETARDAAMGSATAASTSSQTATTKATEASQSASAASTSATTATTKASQATASASSAATSETNAAGYASSAATTLSQVQASNATAIAAVQIEATTRASEDGKLFAQYTVKVDTNGYVSGFGLASTATNAAPTSEFAVRADKFYIANPGGPGVAPATPFIVRTTATTNNGVAVPVGAYIADAFIQNGQITNAKIGNLAVDNAKIASVAVDKLTAGSLSVGQYIQSTGFVTGSSGWRINADGTAEFNSGTFRGSLAVGASPQLSGSSMTGSGAALFQDGRFALGTSKKNITFNGSDLNFNGFNRFIPSSYNLFYLQLNGDFILNSVADFTVTGQSSNILGLMRASSFDGTTFCSGYIMRVIPASQMVYGKKYVIKSRGDFRWDYCQSPKQSWSAMTGDERGVFTLIDRVPDGPSMAYSVSPPGSPGKYPSTTSFVYDLETRVFIDYFSAGVSFWVYSVAGAGNYSVVIAPGYFMTYGDSPTSNTLTSVYMTAAIIFNEL